MVQQMLLGTSSVLTMKTAIFIVGLLSATWAAPLAEEKIEKPPAAIIKQINQVNLDGTYTFGFEADDGSFKVETRDSYGRINGKYGFIDVEGTLRVLEYEAGNTTGFYARSNYLPQPLVPVQIPAKPTSPEQRALDELYQSVDDDQDGIPDTPKQRALVQQAAPAPTIVQPVVPAAQAAARSAPVPAPVAVPTFNFVQPQRVAVASPVAFGAPALQVVSHEPSQREQDEQFQSVDDDQDGIPDPPRPRVRVALPAIPVGAPTAIVQPAVQVNTQPLQFASLRAAPVAAPVVTQQFVRHPSIPDFEQLVRDLQFQSVDADEDGIPDSPAFVRLVVKN